mmetsp:Transcript_91505/g.259176  ORF Transcript_91505/g.259176 Transcript_91505/m.259176 type:complete len:387 (+) Transcript_91505:140-1300(+)
MPNSSSSSSTRERKPKGKKNKSKKTKKQKTDPKHAKKDQRRSERAAAWEFDRSAVRLLAQLLQTDVGIADELESVFSSIDTGETVHLDGLENKQVRKKLRHLLKALKLKQADGQGFCTPDRKVSFAAVFERCLREARGSQRAAEGPAGASPGREASPAAAEQAAEAAGEAREAGEAGEAVGAAPARAERRPRAVGPQLPMPGVGPSAGVASSDEDEGPDAERGPRTEGNERSGIDLDDLESHTRREAWMTTPHESIAAAFGETGPKSARFEVKRSRQEEEAFERMVKSRGPSLLEQHATGSFAASDAKAKSIQEQQRASQDVWGVPEKGGHADGARAAGPRRPFDPEQDLNMPKAVTPTDFSKLVENSVSDLAGRFSRSAVSTSFL